MFCIVVWNLQIDLLADVDVTTTFYHPGHFQFLVYADLANLKILFLVSILQLMNLKRKHLHERGLTNQACCQMDQIIHKIKFIKD